MLHFDTDMPFLPESEVKRLDGQPLTPALAAVPAAQPSSEILDDSRSRLQRIARKFVLFVTLPSLALAGVGLAWLALRLLTRRRERG